MKKITLTDTHKLTSAFFSMREADTIKHEIELAKKKQQKQYYSKNIQEKSNVLPMQIKHWTNSGVIIPHKIARGTGRSHIYDHQNLLEAIICRELNHFSMNINVMKDVLSFLRTKIWHFRLRLGIDLHLFDALDRPEIEELSGIFSKFPDCQSREVIIYELTNSTKHNPSKVRKIIDNESEPNKSALHKCFEEYEEFKVKVEPHVRKELSKFSSTFPNNIDLNDYLIIWDFLKFYPQPESFLLMLWIKSKDIDGAHFLPSGMQLHITNDSNEQIDEIIKRCKSLIIINISDILNEAGSFFGEAEN